MGNVDRDQGWTAKVLSRVVLVVALGLGLCAMHILSAGVSQHHSTVHEAAGTSAGAMVMAHSPALAAPEMPAPEHDQHHPMADCVLFFSAGVTLLVALVAWAARRALRGTPALGSSWSRTASVITPWRGPPEWRWPRISLCVIRV